MKMIKGLMRKIKKILLTDIIFWDKTAKEVNLIDYIFSGEFFKTFTITRVDFIQTTIPHYPNKVYKISAINLNSLDTVELTHHSLKFIINGIRVDIFDHVMFYPEIGVDGIINQFITKIEDDTGVSFDELTMGCMAVC